MRLYLQLFTSVVVVCLLLGTPVSAQTTSQTNPRFYEAQKMIDPGGHLYFYADVKDSLRNFSAELSSQLNAVPDALPIAVMVGTAERVLEMLGILAIEDIALSRTTVDQLPLEKFYLGVAPERPGLFGLGGDKPHNHDLLAYAPEDALLFLCGDTDLKGIYDLLRDMAQQIAGSVGAAAFDQQVQQMNESTGLDIVKLIEATDGQVMLGVRKASNQTFRMPLEDKETIDLPVIQGLFGVRTKDQGVFDQLLTLARNLGIEEAPVAADGMRSFSLPFPQDAQTYPLSPVVAQHQNMLLIASHRDYLDRSLATFKKGGELKKQSDYQRLAKYVPRKGNGLTYLSPQFFDEIVNLTEQFSSLSDDPMLGLLIQQPSGNQAESGVLMVRSQEKNGVLTCTVGQGLKGMSLPALWIGAMMPQTFFVDEVGDLSDDELPIVELTSEARSGLRVLQVALETRFIDVAAYPASAGIGEVVENHASFQDLACLLAPEKYLMELPMDPFQPGTPLKYFRPDPQTSPGLAEQVEYIIWSVGPDGVSNLQSESDVLQYLSTPEVYDYNPDAQPQPSAGDIIRIQRP